MRFADNCCRYTELSSPHRYQFTGACIVCKKQQVVCVPGPELYAYRQGGYIQDTLKTLSDDQREFLMSGICGTCFTNTFKEEED